MAVQADFYVRNGLTEDVSVTCEQLPNGGAVSQATIANGHVERIFLGGTEFSLIIKAPIGGRIKCPLFVKSGIDLAVSYSISPTEFTWKIKIEPNTLPPEVPTTVNVSVGVDEPPT